MTLSKTQTLLWLAGFTLLIAGTFRFGWHTAAIVAGAILIRCASKIGQHRAGGFLK